MSLRLTEKLPIWFTGVFLATDRLFILKNCSALLCCQDCCHLQDLLFIEVVVSE
uniref:Uncharacterized protein n=1 Tax=Anguilla anguilla TaxID=7936 RepID=A0A0E9SGP2_ANGAN